MKIMKNGILILAVFLILFSCKTEKKETVETTVQKNEIPVLALGEFNYKAGEYVNQQVQIHGIVDHVCKHSGKKLLVVTDDGDVHITSDVRFDDTLTGSEINLVGVVVENRIDEATCLQMENDNIKSHAEGASSEQQFETKKKHIQEYRDRMKTENKQYISEFSLKYVSHSEMQ